MCTAIGLRLGDCFFGRNLDLEKHFGECPVLTPRGFSLPLRHEKTSVTRHALIGMAALRNGYPLYAEAINERGIAMAGLNFVGNAAYFDEINANKTNITTFELIPWVLGQAESPAHAKALLGGLHLMSTAFEDELPPGELHWFLTDGRESLVIESTKKGLCIYDDPLCVLTNNPPFPFQVAACMPFWKDEGCLAKEVLQANGICAESLGFTANTISGDYSSGARFTRAAWLVQNAKTLGDPQADLATGFQILSAVAPIHGIVQNANSEEHYTLYSVCANLSRGEFSWRYAECPKTATVHFSDLPLDSKDAVIIDPTIKKG